MKYYVHVLVTIQSIYKYSFLPNNDDNDAIKYKIIFEKDNAKIRQSLGDHQYFLENFLF